jgi:hypothetical protein
MRGLLLKIDKLFVKKVMKRNAKIYHYHLFEFKQKYLLQIIFD